MVLDMNFLLYPSGRRSFGQGHGLHGFDSPAKERGLVLVFDLDGVIYLGTTPIPGAIEALHRLAADGHALYFLTNNSTRSRQTYADRLEGMGYPATAAQFMTSAYATGLYLRSVGAEGKKVYVVGEVGLREEMELAGLTVIPLEDPTPVDYVVAGLDRSVTFAKLQRAHHEIAVHGAQFVATNRDATYPLETGEIPGGGAIVAPIEVSTGVRGVTIGKPEPGTWLWLLELEGAAPEQGLMVGDRAETDILGAKRVGLHTVLTLTGVTTVEMLERLPEEQRPDHVVRDLTELPALVASLSVRS
jgi:phosphoglycolate/pyridoxal phosphate phosphatase family enzyme